MDPAKRNSILLHILLTAVMLALFGLWLTDTASRSPGRVPPPGTPPPGMYDNPADLPRPAGRGRPVRPETMIIFFGIVLTAAANVLARSYVKSQQQKQRMKELEYENLSNQLETLRYQINPHFFMNTLNNIQALIDLSPEKAKESIGEFSKLMRIVLYDGNAPTIPLSKEVDYLNHYISLMRLRYPEQVRISTSFPDNTDGINVPPLLMASFVENAFKHGISYNRKSFVEVSIAKESGRLVFRCSNSRTDESASAQSGIGLDNTRKRLDIIYGSSYSLKAGETADTYEITLILPA